MAVLYFDNKNALIRYEAVAGSLGGDPGAAHVVKFDPATNQALFVALGQSTDGVLRVDADTVNVRGQNFDIAADSDVTVIESLASALTPQQRTAGRQAAKAVVQAALDGQNATSAQLTRALAYVLLRDFLGDTGE